MNRLVSPWREPISEQASPPDANIKRSLAAAIPFVLAVPVLFGAGFVVAGQALLPVPLIAGALGWLAALILRAPLALLAVRCLRNTERVQRTVVLSSGPLEEAARLVVVLVIGRDLQRALWIGLGWAAIEVFYSIVNGFAVAQLASRTDEDAERAKAMLPPQTLNAAAPWWGVVERVLATALHIGFTLVVAAVPAAVVINAVIHSAANYSLLAALRRYSIASVMLAGLVLAGCVLAAGLALHVAA